MKRGKLFWMSVALTATIAAAGLCLAGCSEENGKMNEKNIYINSETGNDNNHGHSPDKALATIQQLEMLGAIAPGTTIYLSGEFTGTMSFVGSGTEKEPIVITSLDPESPARLDGAGRGSTIALHQQSWITIDNLDITLDAQDLQARSGIFVTAEEGIVAGITVKDCYIHDIDGTHLSDVAAGNYWNSFYASGAITFRYLLPKVSEENKFDSLLVTGCRIENILGCGVRLHDMGAGIADEWANAYFSNVVVEDTIIDTTSGDGVIFQNCYKPVLRRCKIFRVGVLEPDGSENFHAAAWACASESPLYEYNEVAYTKYVAGDGQAFDMDWGSKGTAVWQYNFTHHNEGGVILRHEDFKGIYRYNISVNDGSKEAGRGIVFHSSPYHLTKETMYFYNNVFYCDETVDLQISYGFTEHPEWDHFSTALNVFKNNVFVFANGDVNWGENTQYINNCYYRLGDNSYSVPEQDASAIKGDPKFAGGEMLPHNMEEAGAYFTLSEDSPCIDVAADLSTEEAYLSENKNFWGQPANKNVGAI